MLAYVFAFEKHTCSILPHGKPRSLQRLKLTIIDVQLPPKMNPRRHLPGYRPDRPIAFNRCKERGLTCDSILHVCFSKART